MANKRRAVVCMTPSGRWTAEASIHGMRLVAVRLSFYLLVIGSFKRFFGEGLIVGGSRYQLQMIANPPKDHALTSGANISSAMVVNGASPLMQRSVGQPFKIYYNVKALAKQRNWQHLADGSYLDAKLFKST